MSRRQLLSYGVLSVIWGFSFLLLLKVVEAFGWIGAVTFRAFIASAILFILAKVTKRKLDFANNWGAIAVVGTTTVAAQLIGMSFATPRIGTAMAAIFVGAIPLFSMLIGKFWGSEEISKIGFIGLVLGFVGIVLLVGFPSSPITPGFIIGCGGSIFGSFSAAFGSNYAKKHLHSIGSWEQTLGAFLFGGVITLPLLYVVPVPTTPRPIDFVLLVLLAGFVSSLCYVIYFRLVAEVGATRAISVEFVVTVIAVIVGSIVLKEKLTFIQFVGGAVILVGCALVLDLIPPRVFRRITQ